MLIMMPDRPRRCQIVGPVMACSPHFAPSVPSRPIPRLQPVRDLVTRHTFHHLPWVGMRLSAKSTSSPSSLGRRFRSNTTPEDLRPSPNLCRLAARPNYHHGEPVCAHGYLQVHLWAQAATASTRMAVMELYLHLNYPICLSPARRIRHWSDLGRSCLIWEAHLCLDRHLVARSNLLLDQRSIDLQCRPCEDRDLIIQTEQRAITYHHHDHVPLNPSVRQFQPNLPLLDSPTSQDEATTLLA